MEVQNPAAGRKRKRMPMLDVLLDLETRLPNAKKDAVSAASIADNLRKRIDEAAKMTAPDAVLDEDENGMRSDVHLTTVRLWNLVSGMNAEMSKSGPLEHYMRLLLYSQVYASLAHCWCTWSSAPPDERTFPRCLYTMDPVVKTAHACIAKNNTTLAGIVLDRAWDIQSQVTTDLSNIDKTGDYEIIQIRKIATLQQQVLMLSLKKLQMSGQPDKAGSFYIDRFLPSFEKSPYHDTTMVGDLARVFCQIGQDYVTMKNPDKAQVWFQRAQSTLEKLGGEAEAKSTEELRVSVALAEAVAMLEMKKYPAVEQLVAKIQPRVSQGDVTLNLLKLRLLESSQSESFDAAGYAGILKTMIHRFQVPGREFEMLCYRIGKLHNKSPALGCEVHDEFIHTLATRYHEKQQRNTISEMLEKLIVLRVWQLIQQRGSQDELDSAERVLSKIRVRISATAVLSCQTLIWKRIHQSYTEKQYPAAISWCRLALCRVFEDMSTRSTEAIIARKLLLCCIEGGKYDTAVSTFSQMPESVQDEPMTRYTLFKLAVSMNNQALAIECLRCLATAASSRKYLYSCVVFAKHAKAPKFMVQALKRLADAINKDGSADLHMPSLFRCGILMLRYILSEPDESEKENTGRENETIIECAADSDFERNRTISDLADMFEGVVESIKMSRESACEGPEQVQFTMDELEWFCRAAYNSGLQYSITGDGRMAVRMFSSCLNIIQSFPKGQESEVATNVRSKSENCHFIIASALAAQVRKPSPETPAERVKKDCQAMREHIAEFQNEVKDQLLGVSSALQAKLSALLIFDFEGAIRLAEWDELQGICEHAEASRNSDTLRVLGDCLLQSIDAVPSDKFVTAMRLIIDKLRAMDDFNNEKLAGYYRTLFQATIYHDNEAAYRILEELDDIVHGSGHSVAYTERPEDEFLYLAVAAYNEGVDWFSAGREERAKEWARLALRLAGRCQGGDELRKEMQGRLSVLQLGSLGSPEDDPTPSVEIPRTGAGGEVATSHGEKD